MYDQIAHNIEPDAKEDWRTPEFEVLATTNDVAGGTDVTFFEDFTGQPVS